MHSEIRELLAALAVEAHIPMKEGREMTLGDAQAVLAVLEKKNQSSSL